MGEGYKQRSFSCAVLSLETFLHKFSSFSRTLHLFKINEIRNHFASAVASCLLRLRLSSWSWRKCLSSMCAPMVVLMTGTTKPSGIFGAKKAGETSTSLRMRELRSPRSRSSLTFVLAAMAKRCLHLLVRRQRWAMASIVSLGCIFRRNCFSLQRCCQRLLPQGNRQTGKLRASTSTTGDRIKKGV